MKIVHILLGTLVAFLWAANFVAVKLGFEAGLSPALLTALRFAVIALLVPFFARPFRWLIIIVLGALIGLGQLGLSALAIAVGYSPGLASLVMQMQVFFTLLFSIILLQEKPELRQFFGISLAGLGVLFLAFSKDEGGNNPLLGLILLLLAAISWALSNIIIRQQQKAASPVAIAVWISAIATLPLFVLSWVLEGPPLTILSEITIPLIAILVILYCGIFSTLITTSIWSWLLERYPATQVAPLSLAVPVFGISLSVAIFDENFTVNSLIAILLIMTGLLIFLYPRSRT